LALKINSATRINGASCDHLLIEIDDEGVTREVRTSFSQIDAQLNQLNLSPIEMKRTLVLLWAAYRRSKSRAIVNVEIA
jgi:hypothetical protein